LGECGLYEEEIALLERGLRVAPENVWLLATEAVAYAHLGRMDAISRIAATMDAMRSQRPVSKLALGLVQGASGNTERAATLLEGAIEEREIWVVSFLRQPYCAALLPVPLYESLLRKMNLPVAYEKIGSGSK
jgi:hypothetical protein